MCINIDTEINTKFETSNLGKNKKNINSWASSIFGKEVQNMNTREKEKVLSYIIIKNNNITFKSYLESLSQKLGIKNDRKFKADIHNVFPPEKYSGSVDDRTELLHKLVFLVEVENKINDLQEKLRIKKDVVVKETKENLISLKQNKNLSVHQEENKNQEISNINKNLQVLPTKNNFINYNDSLSKISSLKGKKGYCSRRARDNLENIFGIENPHRNNAKQLIKMQNLVCSTKSNISDEIENLYNKFQANVFDIYIPTKNKHRAVAFKRENGGIYILDPDFGANTATPIENYKALLNHKQIYIGYLDANGKIMKSSRSGLA